MTSPPSIAETPPVMEIVDFIRAPTRARSICHRREADDDGASSACSPAAARLPVRVDRGVPRRRPRLLRACASRARPIPATVADAPHAWVRLGAVGEALKPLREAGVDGLVLAGPVTRPSLDELRPDWRGAQFLAAVGARAFGDDGLLSADRQGARGRGLSRRRRR